MGPTPWVDVGARAVRRPHTSQGRGRRTDPRHRHDRAQEGRRHRTHPWAQPWAHSPGRARLRGL